MIETIKMSGIISAEMQHEIDAAETAQKWRDYCRKAREDGTMPKKAESP